jgi:hypothetical protein
LIDWRRLLGSRGRDGQPEARGQRLEGADAEIAAYDSSRRIGTYLEMMDPEGGSDHAV